MNILKDKWCRILAHHQLPDWPVRFLEKAEPGKYVQALKDANVDAVYLDVRSLSGQVYLPEEMDDEYGNIKRKTDYLKELIPFLKKVGITPLGYFILSWGSNSKRYPSDWLIRKEDGTSLDFGDATGWGRGGVGWDFGAEFQALCINSPYGKKQLNR